MSKEIWKDIEGYEGMYQVSTLGRVKSLDHYAKFINKGTPCKRFHKGKILKAIVSRFGYKRLWLRYKRVQRVMSVHRLVAKAFIPNPDNKPQVNHINCIKADNKIENLEWNTTFENMHHAYSNNMIPANRGEKSGTAKLTNKKVLKIRKMFESRQYTMQFLADKFKVSITTISLIIRRITWKHI